KADIRALQQLTPLRARSGLEQRRELLAQGRPLGLFPLTIELRVRDVTQSEQLPVELRLDRAQRDMATVLAFVCAVEVRGTVQEVLLTRIAPEALGHQAILGRHQQRSA